MPLSLSQLAKSTGAELSGDGACVIERAADVASAGQGDIAFVYTAKYSHHLITTRATALVVSRALADQCSMPCLIADDPRLAFAKVVALLYPVTRPAAGISETAIVGPNTDVDPSAYLDSGVVVKSGASIGAGVYVGANTVIGENARVGMNTYINANVTFGKNCVIGSNGIIHSGVVIGADGFGFVKDGDSYFKVPQIGNVLIGDHVEIGACTSIDRGSLGDTIIGNGVKIDNQIQIGHNVEIGDNTVISACTCIAGTAKIGANCLIGGSVGIRDNIEIVDNTVITGRTFVSSAITTAGVYSSSTLMDTNENWRRNVSRFKQLDAIAKRLTSVEKAIGKVFDKDNNNN